jgi:hypothetical protein
MSAHSLLILAALVGGCSVASPASAEQFNVQSSAVLVKTSLSFSSNQPRNFTLREKLAQRCKRLAEVCVDTVQCCPPFTCENSVCSLAR